jgi:hypothetical protein
MTRAADPKRVRDIEAALKRAPARSRLKLGDCALIWNVTKPRFVSVRNQMPDFPDPVDKEGNEYIYPARKALQAMLRYEKRHEAVAARRAEMTAQIMGKGRREANAASAGFSVNELAGMSRLANEVEEREINQGLYIPRAEVARVAGDVFSEISELLSRLSYKVDPSGRLPMATRVAIDTAGKEQLLKAGARMKDILEPDAQSARNRAAASRAGKPRVRR